MKRPVEAFVFLLLVFSVALIGYGMEIGAKLGTQTPSLVIQASWDVAPNLAMGFFLDPPLETLFNPPGSQTPSIAIGFIGKYQTMYLHAGLSGGVEFEPGGTRVSVSIDALVGVRVPLFPRLMLYAELAFPIVPLPDLTAWYNLGSWYKDLYLGFAFLI